MSTPVRFADSARTYLMVTVPLNPTPGVLAHRTARYTISVDSDGVTWVSPHNRGTDQAHFVRPACLPTPDDHDTTAGQGWFECSAGWADHLGALACPDCFPQEGEQA